MPMSEADKQSIRDRTMAMDDEDAKQTLREMLMPIPQYAKDMMTDGQSSNKPVFPKVQGKQAPKASF